MIIAGEVDHLVAERVWAELFKALNEASPSAFFYTLKSCAALAKIFPEIDCLFGVPQPEKYHPEIDTGIHVMLCLDQAALMSASPEVRFAALVHDLGKGLSPKEHWPHHHGHESHGLPILEQMCIRLRVPKSFRALAIQVMQYHSCCHRVFELRASTITDMLAAIGAYKPTNKLPDFLLACKADAKGRTGFESAPYPQAEFLFGAAKAAASVDTSAVLNGKLKGTQIGAAIRRLRIKAVSEFMKGDQP
jgi:tRNA nucleotidyltransferase (CCA-adding enzyme)